MVLHWPQRLQILNIYRYIYHVIAVTLFFNTLLCNLGLCEELFFPILTSFVSQVTYFSI